MRELIKGKRLEEAAGKSFYDYLGDASENFLKSAIKPIKKVAGSHAEKVMVMRRRNTSWLEYTGQDRSDMDIRFSAYVLPGDGFDAILTISGMDGYGKHIEKDVRTKAGQLDADMIVGHFRDVFGR